MRFLPVFLDVTSGPVALVGSGEQAVAKLRLLLRGARHRALVSGSYRCRR